jgi:hypothetical protein
VLVDLVLKRVRIDCADSDAAPSRRQLHISDIPYAVWKIPKNVHRQCRAATSDAMNLRSIGEFLFQRHGGAGLKKLSEAGAGISKAPTWQLDTKIVEYPENRFSLTRGEGHRF